MSVMGSWDGERGERLARRALRGDYDATWRLFLDRVAAGRIKISTTWLLGSPKGGVEPAKKAMRDLADLAGKPILVHGEVRSAPWGYSRLGMSNAVLLVVDAVENHRSADVAHVDFSDGSTTPEWRGIPVVEHRMLGTPNVIFFQGPAYASNGQPMPPDVSFVITFPGVDPGEELLVARWLESFGWGTDDEWYERILRAGGAGRTAKNPIFGPVERREAFRPPACPACAASWERFVRRRGGFYFLCKRHAEEARARRDDERKGRRIRDIERSGDPGWTFDPDLEPEG